MIVKENKIELWMYRIIDEKGDESDDSEYEQQDRGTRGD